MEMEAIEELKSDHLYIEVADRIETLIAKQSFKVGDKLLSVRALSKEQGISLSTAFQAYYHLESKGLIEARPQSGYYVRFSPQHGMDLPTCCKRPSEVTPVTLDDIISSVYQDLRSESLTHFSISSPDYSLLPTAKLNKAVVQALRDSKDSCLNYEDFQGNINLRQQIARLSFNWGGALSEEDIVVTNGCMEAISLCLKAVTKPGDAVAIDSPTYYGIFQVIESLGLKVVEIPSRSDSGLDLECLESSIEKFDIKACLFVCNFNNPLGNLMSDKSKKSLVELLTRKDIPLIEDDIYGELYFGKTRPKACKVFDKKGIVLQCSSFSKSLAPGYRIGWAVPGKYKNKVIALKRMNNVSTNTLLQEAIAIFLKKGRYELHLRHLRKALHTQCLRYSQAITTSFPAGTKVSRPEGGFSLWIELDKKVDAYKLHKQALKHNIGIAPGHIFSTQDKFQNYFRLSYGLPWNDKVSNGIQVLGDLIKKFK